MSSKDKTQDVATPNPTPIPVVPPTVPSTNVMPSTAPVEGGLKRNAVGLWHVVFQAQSHVAPAADTALLLTGAAAIAFGAMPLVIVLAWVGYFLLLNTNYQFSKYISSAAGYYGFAANGPAKSGAY